MAHNEFSGGADSPDAGIRVSRRIADELRRCRVARGLSIEDVAKTLRIRAGFIAAMEQDRFDDLPGPAYISGFLRTYANHLGLDGEQLVAWFKDDSQSTFATRKMELPVPIAEIRRPTFPIITTSLVVSIAIAAAWYVYQESRSIHIDPIPEAPAPVAEGIATDIPSGDSPGAVDGDDVLADTGTKSAAVESAVTEAYSAPDAAGTPDAGDDAADDGPDSVATGAQGGVAPDHAGNDAVVDGAVTAGQDPALADIADATVSAVQADPPPDVADATGTAVAGEEWWGEPVFASADTVRESVAAADGGGDGQNTVYGTPGAGSRIALRATAETWVQIMAPDGVAVLTHILLPGDVYHVPDRDDLMLDTGNAGGLEIRVDGRPIPSLGDAGAVVRDILLSVESLTRR